MQKREASLRDRIVAAISYITMGYGGFFYLIYEHIIVYTISEYTYR